MIQIQNDLRKHLPKLLWKNWPSYKSLLYSHCCTHTVPALLYPKHQQRKRSNCWNLCSWWKFLSLQNNFTIFM